MTRTRQLVVSLKEANQDFEWFPTTLEMIAAVKKRMPEGANSIMDIGAGDGRVLKWLAEKSRDVKPCIINPGA